MNNTNENRILLVDDEEDQLRSLQLGLRRKGYQVSTAKNGLQAIDRLGEDGAVFDLVVTDYAMPGMDGLTLLKNIRRQNKKLKVLMMTAYGAKALLVDAVKNQLNGYIEKPFDMEEFISEIQRTIKYSERELKIQKESI